MKAFLKNYRQSPRKVRLVAGLIKGKRVAQAFTLLENLPKRASMPLVKLLKSAVANATSSGINIDDLIVENVTVNKGVVLKRFMPRARGSASRINKRTSHVVITLSDKGAKHASKQEKEEVKSKDTKEKKVKKVVTKKKAQAKKEDK